MHRTILLTGATMILLAAPVYAAPVDKGLQGGAAQAGCSSCTNQTQSGSEEHPNAEGRSFSSPPSFPWSAGVSGKDSSEGSVSGGGSSDDGNGSSGNDPDSYGNTGSL